MRDFFSPYNADSNGWANVFRVDSNGYLTGNNNVTNTFGVRPISFYNLKVRLRLNLIELGYKINH